MLGSRVGVSAGGAAYVAADNEEKVETELIQQCDGEERERGNVSAIPSKKLVMQFEKCVAAYNFEECLWLVDAGQVPVDLVLAGGETLFTRACGCGEKAIVAALLQHGCDVNKQNSVGRTGLMKACAGGHTSIVQLLLTAVPERLDPFQKDCKGKTALDWARVARHAGCAQELSRFVQADIAEERQFLADIARMRTLEKRVLQVNAGLREEMQSMIRDNKLEHIFLDDDLFPCQRSLRRSRFIF